VYTAFIPAASQFDASTVKEHNTKANIAIGISVIL
jgi:hypothetical protein